MPEKNLAFPIFLTRKLSLGGLKFYAQCVPRILISGRQNIPSWKEPGNFGFREIDLSTKRQTKTNTRKNTRTGKKSVRFKNSWVLFGQALQVSGIQKMDVVGIAGFESDLWFDDTCECFLLWRSFQFRKCSFCEPQRWPSCSLALRAPEFLALFVLCWSYERLLSSLCVN